MSTDEKTGVQALHPTKPTRPNLTERIEFEYKRHGTLCLIANFDVVTGKVIVPSVGPTRTEEDFRRRLLGFIENVNAVFAKPFRWTYAGKPGHE